MSDCACQKEIAGLREELIHARERLAKLEEHSHEPQEIAPRVILELVRLGYVESSEAAEKIIEDVARRRATAGLSTGIETARCREEAASGQARHFAE